MSASTFLLSTSGISILSRGAPCAVGAVVGRGALLQNRRVHRNQIPGDATGCGNNDRSDRLGPCVPILPSILLVLIFQHFDSDLCGSRDMVDGSLPGAIRISPLDRVDDACDFGKRVLDA